MILLHINIITYIDINECKNTNECHNNAQCKNTVGSFVCKCKSGYIGDGTTNCDGKS